MNRKGARAGGKQEEEKGLSLKREPKRSENVSPVPLKPYFFSAQNSIVTPN
jgi:hypothetical protein